MDRQVDDIIEKFVEGYYFLSNFYPSSLWLDGMRYPTAEHAMQAQKSLDPIVRETIRSAKTPWEAKRLGRCITIREDWEQVKDDLMMRVLRAKFENPLIRTLLLSTAPKKLIHGNTWNDRHWGVCRGAGKNVLGSLLEKLRDELARDEI